MNSITTTSQIKFFTQLKVITLFIQSSSKQRLHGSTQQDWSLVLEKELVISSLNLEFTQFGTKIRLLPLKMEFNLETTFMGLIQFTISRLWSKINTWLSLITILVLRTISLVNQMLSNLRSLMSRHQEWQRSISSSQWKSVTFKKNLSKSLVYPHLYLNGFWDGINASMDGENYQKLRKFMTLTTERYYL